MRKQKLQSSVTLVTFRRSVFAPFFRGTVNRSWSGEQFRVSVLVWTSSPLTQTLTESLEPRQKVAVRASGLLMVVRAYAVRLFKSRYSRPNARPKRTMPSDCFGSFFFHVTVLAAARSL